MVIKIFLFFIAIYIIENIFAFIGNMYIKKLDKDIDDIIENIDCKNDHK